jgi:hypothetical protein
VIYHHSIGIEPVFNSNIHASGSASFFIAMRRVNLNRQAGFLRQLELKTVIFFFRCCLIVKTNLSHTNYPFFINK